MPLNLAGIDRQTPIRTTAEAVRKKRGVTRKPSGRQKSTWVGEIAETWALAADFERSVGSWRPWRAAEKGKRTANWTGLLAKGARRDVVKAPMREKGATTM